MKKLMVFTLVMVVVGVTVLHVGAVPTVPPIPTPPPTTPPDTPEPPDDGGGGTTFPLMETQHKFEVISAEPVMEGYAGGSIIFNLKVIQKGYPDLVVNLTAEVPDKWKASFSKNDFDLKAEESVELTLSLSPPENVSAEQHEVKIRAVGKAKEDSLEVKDSLTLTAMTYLIDVGIANLQLQPAQPLSGENVSVIVTAVNYTQRVISDVVVEFLVNNGLITQQTVTLTAGASQSLTFGWTAQPGAFSLMVRTKAAGDSNRRNDSATQSVILESGTEQVEMLYQQAMAFFAQENYSQARDLFQTVVVQYTDAGETAKALQASEYMDLCDSYIEAQDFMNRGDSAFQMENFEEAAQYYRQARDVYSQLNETDMQALAQQKLDEALASTGFEINMMMVGIAVVAVVAVILVALQISRRRRRPVESHRPSRFRLEESREAAPPPTRPVTTRPTREAVTPTTGAAPPGELVQFHQKTEDALSRFTKGYVRDNLQQAMRAYLSLEGEKKQLPRGRDLELERIIDTNLKELEHRIFGTF